MTLDDSAASGLNLRELIERQPRLAIGLGAGLIAFLTLVAYLPILSAGYVWQDDVNVAANPLLRDASGLGRIWTDVLPRPAEYALPQYYPLTYTSYWVEYRLWGDDPLGYHLVNLLLHIGNALLVWLLLRKLNVPGAWLAGLIFALHPMNLETVGWISQRSTLLGLFFFLSSLYVFLRYSGVIAPAPGPRWLSLPDDPQRLYWLVALLFLCALLSKTFYATMPAVALLLIVWKKRRLTQQDWGAALPLLALGIAMGLLTVYIEIYRGGIAQRPQFWDLAPTAGGELAARCIVAGRAVWFYLLKLVAPYPLIFNYPRWKIDPGQAWQYLFPAGVVLVLILLLIGRKRLGWAAMVAALYFVGTLLPVLGLIDFVQMQYSFVADHLAYLSGIGLFALVAAAAGRYLGARNLPVPVTVIALALMVATFNRAGVFRSDKPLWEDTLIKTHNTSWLAMNNYGMWIRDDSPIQNMDDRLSESEKRFKRASQLAPAHPEPIYNLAIIAEMQSELAAQALAATEPSTQAATAPAVPISTSRPQEYDELALAYFEQAVAVDPNYVPAQFHMAELLLGMGRTADAVPHYVQCVKLAPRYEAPLERLAAIWTKAGKPDVAEPFLRKLADLEPDSGNIHRDLGWVLYLQGNVVEALSQWDSAIALAPNDARILNVIGSRLTSVDDFQRAMVYLVRAYQIDPNSPDILTNLGMVNARLGQKDDARQLFNKALKQDADYAEAKQDLADLEAGRIQPATTRAATGPATSPATARQN